jgi:hypothetical protein
MKQEHKTDTKKKIEKMCAYCNRRPAEEEEHVIARGFFMQPYPLDLPKLPACALCNRGQWTNSSGNMSADEEYTRTCLASLRVTGNHPAARQLLTGKIPRAMQRPSQFARTMRATASFMDIISPGGIIIPNQPVLQLDWPRIERVLVKITRGLYYTVIGTTVPEEYGVAVQPYLPQEQAQTAVDFIASGRYYFNRFQDGTFTVIGGQPDPNDPFSVWLMSFYDAHHVLTFVLPYTFDTTQHGFEISSVKPPP